MLLDAAAHEGVERLEPGAAVQNLEQVASTQRTVVAEGDVVLVRTGNGALWESRAEYEPGAGIGVASSRWLAERRPFAFVCLPLKMRGGTGSPVRPLALVPA